MRLSTKALAVGVLVAGALVLPATAAQAAPGDCTLTRVYNTASVVCGSGTGTYRVVAECWIGHDSLTVEGPAVGIGGTSSVTCYGSGPRLLAWQYEVLS
ncbi:hypothetical protein [Longispora urticae]